jgi:hypothetical protein
MNWKYNLIIKEQNAQLLKKQYLRINEVGESSSNFHVLQMKYLT